MKNHFTTESPCQTYTFANGLRIIHRHFPSEIAYCGFAVNTGARDENTDEFGLAHFTEHMLFKGTHKRRAHHIAGRMENVGGELNAYTTKEETFVYSVFLDEYMDRATELLCDLMFNSCFPPQQIDRERDVILDEISTYNDSPAELIYDDFENLLFRDEDLGHYILGSPQSLENIDREKLARFTARQYQPSQMVFFSFGKTPFPKIVRHIEKHISPQTGSINPRKRNAPDGARAQKEIGKKGTSQAHVIIGNRGYGMFHEDKYALYLLSNLLGGDGMNSRLNVSLREKNGLVYNVETATAFYSDSGVFAVYFGCDPKNADKCVRLVKKEFNKLKEIPLSPQQLAIAKRQLKGQIGISSENHENQALGMAKGFLHTNTCKTIDKVFEEIDAIPAGQIQKVACQTLQETTLSEIRYI